MPNWVANKLFITGSQREIERFRGQADSTDCARKGEESTCVSFGRFVSLKTKRKLSNDGWFNLAIR